MLLGGDDDGGVSGIDALTLSGKIDDIRTYVPCTSEQEEDDLSAPAGMMFSGGVDLSRDGGTSSPWLSISSRISRMRSDVGVKAANKAGVGTS